VCEGVRGTFLFTHYLSIHCLTQISLPCLSSYFAEVKGRGKGAGRLQEPLDKGDGEVLCKISKGNPDYPGCGQGMPALMMCPICKGRRGNSTSEKAIVETIIEIDGRGATAVRICVRRCQRHLGILPVGGGWGSLGLSQHAKHREHARWISSGLLGHLLLEVLLLL